MENIFMQDVYKIQGFVGGHCISIDPHYLAFQAKRHGVYTDLLLTARKVNDNMTLFVAEALAKILVKHGMAHSKLKVCLFGATYKENVHDLRNSLALKLLKELKTYGIECMLHDPLVGEKVHQQSVTPWEKVKNLDIAILTVGHDYYKQKGLQAMLDKCNTKALLMDIPSLWAQHKDDIHPPKLYWHL